MQLSSVLQHEVLAEAGAKPKGQCGYTGQGLSLQQLVCRCCHALKFALYTVPVLKK